MTTSLPVSLLCFAVGLAIVLAVGSSILRRRIDAVPAPWSGPRTPPLPEITPYRPVNRMPGGRTGRPVPGE